MGPAEILRCGMWSFLRLLVTVLILILSLILTLVRALGVLNLGTLSSVVSRGELFAAGPPPPGDVRSSGRPGGASMYGAGGTAGGGASLMLH